VTVTQVDDTGAYKGATAEVVRRDQLTPSMLRIVVAGEHLAPLTTARPGGYVKLVLPESGGQPRLPRLEGPSWPEGEPRPPRRSFTIRHFDTATDELTVDFALHDGLASDWARAARLGDPLGIIGPADLRFQPTGDHLVLAADDAGLPALAAIVEALPPSCRADAFVEVDGPDHEQPIDHGPHVSVTWLHRHDTPAHESEQLWRAVLDWPWPGSDTQGWAAAETVVARKIRSYLRDERGLGVGGYYASAYWRAGHERT
jgi:NADPH-dependent ferric siderophore reductase